MSKYLFYAAFLYFCYYAGNKAFPSKQTVPIVIESAERNFVVENDNNSSTALKINSNNHLQDTGWMKEISLKEIKKDLISNRFFISIDL